MIIAASAIRGLNDTVASQLDYTTINNAIKDHCMSTQMDSQQIQDAIGKSLDTLKSIGAVRPDILEFCARVLATILCDYSRSSPALLSK